MDEGEQIIKLVSERDVLWNLSHRNYKNNKIKAKEWNIIAEELNMPMEIVKKKWRNFRDNYARAISKKSISEEAESDNDCFGKYSAQLEFLRPHLRHRSRTGNYRSPSQDEPSMSPSLLQTYEDQNSIWVNSLDVEDTYQSTPNSHSAEPPKKRKKDDTDKTLISTMESVQEFLKKPSKKSVIVQQSSHERLTTEDELFWGSLMEKFSKFPLHLRNTAKEEMLRYLNQLEMNWHNGTVHTTNQKHQAR